MKKSFAPLKLNFRYTKKNIYKQDYPFIVDSFSFVYKKKHSFKDGQLKAYTIKIVVRCTKTYPGDIFHNTDKSLG